MLKDKSAMFGTSSAVSGLGMVLYTLALSFSKGYTCCDSITFILAITLVGDKITSFFVPLNWFNPSRKKNTDRSKVILL